MTSTPASLSRPVPGSPPPGQSSAESRSRPALESPAPIRPRSRQHQAVSYGDFISEVQALGAAETAGEADRATRATLGELAGCVSWPLGQNLAASLPRQVRQLLSRRSFDSSMSRFSPAVFLRSVAAQQDVDLRRAARDTRAVLLALDHALPEFVADQLHKELVSLWGPLTDLPRTAIEGHGGLRPG
jgi:uncharacterized protein (DUF2267 family)